MAKGFPPGSEGYLPPQRTTEQYEADKEAGINWLPHWKMPIDNRKTT